MCFLTALDESSGSEQSDREGEPNGESAVDEDEREDGEDEDEEEEEEEPRLKYQRLSADVAEILAGNAASCLCVSDKLLALGTHDGTLHVLDINGNEVHTIHSLFFGVWRIILISRICYTNSSSD